LWDGFEPVCMKVNRDTKTLKDLSTYFQKRAEIEEQYAKSIKKLTQSAGIGKGETGTFGIALAALKTEADDTAELHASFSQKISTELTTEILTFLQTTKKQREKLINQGTAITKDLTGTKMNETKTKEKYYKLAEKGKTDEKLNKKVEESNVDYSKKVGALRDAQRKHYENMPTLLTELQTYDENALDKAKYVLSNFGILFNPLGPTTTNNATKLKTGLESFDRQKDVKEFIQENYTGQQPPPMASYTPYGTDPSTINKEDFPFGRSSVTPEKSSSGSSLLVAPSSSLNLNSTNQKKPTRISTLFSSPPNVTAEVTDTTATTTDYENYDYENYNYEQWRCEALYAWTAEDPG